MGYRAIVEVCWELLPELSMFSSLKLLQKIVPQQFSYDLNYIIWYDDTLIHRVPFLISRPIILIIGFDCFLIKFRASVPFVNPDPPSTTIDFGNVVGSIIFMNQVLAVVQITKTLKWRLYRFVFAGENGILEPDKRIKQDVWEAMV